MKEMQWTVKCSGDEWESKRKEDKGNIEILVQLLVFKSYTELKIIVKHHQVSGPYPGFCRRGGTAF